MVIESCSRRADAGGSANSFGCSQPG